MNPEDLYLTSEEVCEILNISKRRIFQLKDAGFIKQLKGNVYDRASVEAYKLKRGDKKGGRYPKQTGV